MNKNTIKDKSGKGFRLLLILLLLICLTIGLCFFGYYKLSQIEMTPLNEKDLSVNSKLYDDVSDKLDKKEFDQIINIVLFGSDSRNIKDASQGRTDCIMIASLNPIKKTIKLISIPRDSYVNIPGYGGTKINHAYAYGGEQLTIKTINSNFGLNITEYVTINFAGLINVVNSIGGVEVDITKPEMNAINEYLKESYNVSGREYKPLTQYGEVTLNGEEALSHARDRSVGSDFERARRQRDVLISLSKKISCMKLTAATSLISNDFLQHVKTNVNISEYIGILVSIITNKDIYLNNIRSVQVPSRDYGYDTYIHGTYYFAFDDDMAKQDLYKYIYEE